MDQQTAEFYAHYAKGGGLASESDHSAMAPFILAALPAGAAALDVGAGSGRDVAMMLDAGIDAWGVEPDPTMREAATSRRPGLFGRLRDAALPALGRPFAEERPEGFDGVVCSAVLMHVQPTDLLPALRSLAAQLRPQPGRAEARVPGMIFISLPTLAEGLLAEGRDRDGRQFFNHDAGAIESEMSLLGLRLERQVTRDVSSASGDTLWWTLIFRREILRSV